MPTYEEYMANDEKVKRELDWWCQICHDFTKSINRVQNVTTRMPSRHSPMAQHQNMWKQIITGSSTQWAGPTSLSSIERGRKTTHENPVSRCEWITHIKRSCSKCQTESYGNGDKRSWGALRVNSGEGFAFATCCIRRKKWDKRQTMQQVLSTYFFLICHSRRSVEISLLFLLLSTALEFFLSFLSLIRLLARKKFSPSDIKQTRRLGSLCNLQLGNGKQKQIILMFDGLLRGFSIHNSMNFREIFRGKLAESPDSS